MEDSFDILITSEADFNHAFPLIVGKDREVLELGITMHDYFAARAMQTILQNNPTQTYTWIAKSAYSLAREMMKARDE